MKRLLAALTAAVMMAALVASVAVAAPKPTNLWNVYNINSGGAAYTPKSAPGTSTSVAGFSFPSTPTTALLTTTQDKSLLGDLTGKMITANFTVTTSGAAVFTYGGAPDGCGSAPAVRLYFTGNTKGKFTYDSAGYSKFWWSNPQAATLVGNTLTVTAPVDTANWSDWGGELASSVPTYFATAASQVSEIGLSFGGGCFFANGVGMSAGSASFTLTSYSIS